MKPPLIDCQDNGIGDVVLAAWLLHSAKAAGLALRLNPRNQVWVTSVLALDSEQLSSEAGLSWSRTESIGTQYEYQHVPITPATRFDLWCDSLKLPRLSPVRPSYVEHPADAAWAEEHWNRIDQRRSRRAVLFPAAAWPLRCWPKAYYIDLAAMLLQRGVVAAGLGATKDDVDSFPGQWLWGFDIPKVAALIRRADLVIANDSGPAHLSGTIGVPTLAICGPTRGRLVFGHDANVKAVSLDVQVLPCTGCHFSDALGFRDACRFGGCQALMRLAPDEVFRIAMEIVECAYQSH